VEKVLAKDVPGAFALITELNEDGMNWEQFGLDLLACLSALLALNVGTAVPDAAAADFSSDALKRLKTLAGQTSSHDLQRFTDSAIVRRNQIKTAPLPELPLQLLAIEFAGGAPSAPTHAPTTGASMPAREVAPEPIPASAPESEKKPKPKNHSITESLKSAISTITRTSAPPKTTVEQIKDKWTELISSISAQNHSLTFILSMVNLTAVDGEGLHLTFPYSLHKEKIEEHKNRKIIEECLAAKFGEPIRLVCALAPSAAPPTPAADAELTGLALEFGGEVVS
jgi:DNA polymerase III gamma/tau subunit